MAAVEVVMERSNSVARFVQAHIDSGNGYQLLWSEVEDAYNKFCGEKGIPPVGPKVLSREFNTAVTEQFNAFKSRKFVKIAAHGDSERRETYWSNVRFKVVSPQEQGFSLQDQPDFATETASTEAEIYEKEADFLDSERVAYSDA
jgi:hypothetical protein